MTKRKLKPIEVDRDTYRIMEKIWGPGKVPYNPTIVDRKIFVTTTEEEVKKQDGKQSDSNI